MIETGKPSLMQRVVGFATGRGAASFGGAESARPQTPPAQAAMIWLAGRPMKTRTPRRIRTSAPHDQEVADRILATEPPQDPVEAAALRSDLLRSLCADARHDERVRDIFANDPLVVRDRSTGYLVTRSMLNARLSHFDLVSTLLGRPVASAGARVELEDTLIDAFSVLSIPAQAEWAASEARLQQASRFIESREGAELRALSAELDAVFEARGLWDAARLFAHAAQLGLGSDGWQRPVAPLLELREELLAA